MSSAVSGLITVNHADQQLVEDALPQMHLLCGGIVCPEHDKRLLQLIPITSLTYKQSHISITS